MEPSRSQERQVAYAQRRKTGLETPLVGRFYGENKLLVFAPPLWYDTLVGLCVLGGGFSLLWLLLKGGEDYQIWTAVAVTLAGVWAVASNERMICDLRKKTYIRFEGGKIGQHVVSGSFSDLEALVLTAEQYPHGTGLGAVVFYRLVLHWKGRRHPPLGVEKERRTIPFGAPLNYAAQGILSRGAAYANALGVPYYDNSHMHGHSPVPVL